jgi:bacterioferritin-associated ferredoxin
VTDPTTPTAAQLRQDAAHYRELAASRGCVADCLTCARDHRAAAALDAEAARLEREAADALTSEAQRLGMYTLNPSETPNSSPKMAELDAAVEAYREELCVESAADYLLQYGGVMREKMTPMAQRNYDADVAGHRALVDALIAAAEARGAARERVRVEDGNAPRP